MSELFPPRKISLHVNVSFLRKTTRLMPLQMPFYSLLAATAGEKTRLVRFLNMLRPDSGHGQVSVSRSTTVIGEGAT
jgi:hypothetical protein